MRQNEELGWLGDSASWTFVFLLSVDTRLNLLADYKKSGIMLVQ